MESFSRMVVLLAIAALLLIYVNHGGAGVKTKLRAVFLGKA